jgi:mono/diheme cytochrome c family protein
MRTAKRAAIAGARPRVGRTASISTLVLVASSFLVTGIASADDEAARLYGTLCASCHGASGRGDGPAAEALSPRPTDLTASTASVPELMRIIDGRRTVRAHGDAAMPVWGRTFEQALEGSGREHRDALNQVQMLAEYVRSLQKKPAS